MQNLFKIILIFLFLSTNLCYGDNSGSKKNQLTQIKQQITHLKNKLTSDKKQKKQLTTELRNTEIKIGKINSELNRISVRIQKQENKLSSLQSQSIDTQNNLEEQQQHIREQLKIAYAMSRQNPIKLILNQQAPDTVSRNLIYFRYLNQDQQNRIAQLNQQLAALASEKDGINREKLQLTRLKKAQKDQQNSLKNSDEKRQQVLKKINSHIKQQSDQLAQLEVDKKQLEKIITQLAKNTHYQQKPFRQMRQFLLWPINGKVIRRFGMPIAHSDISWNGILIRAPEGRAVHAIYPGKVAFADWLKGFGELVIIDHGGGFMTLYSRNRQIYKKVGDYVKNNEVIAEAGQSGGFKEPGLYFEIRYNGKPLNPEKWLKKQG